ncbi:hypothetical protein JR316_0000071 [Psilocybe cubensis]|uniref:Uncharacterized protein n=2 Tax=Psilocybe cubensis TaxID=181762 RepID=A0ACB8HDL3_PSICU|nr:hypothetical protein JR316_0000071 [Psilocybe cubensis]KAH9486008.1 hypothetical protein JR316_0000071 [Psilocybe cubensis]
MSKDSTNNLIFRNFLTSDYPSTKATAFTPDIIPHYGNRLKRHLLIKEYPQFISLPVQPNETNYVYIRGKSTSDVEPGAKTAVVLRAAPSELILWPQVWNKVKPTGPGPLVVKSSAPDEVVACVTPFRLKPPNMGGVNYALIATQSLLNILPPPPEARLRDTLPHPPADAKNWKEFADFLNNDTSTVYYNVVVADPKAPIISVSTRLRVFDDGTEPLKFHIGIENSIMPEGTLFSLSSATGTIYMVKSRLVDHAGIHVDLEPGFDDIITLNIFPGPKEIIDTFAWVSLQISIIQPPSESARSIPVENTLLLGALNVVFHDEATTNFCHASHASNQLKTYFNTANAESTATATAAQGESVTTQNASPSSFDATGWWFRNNLGDTKHFPRPAGFQCGSPDIQPIGIRIRPDVQTILGGSNAGTDWSAANQIQLHQGEPNFIYLRGNCTTGSDYTVQARLFCIPSKVALSPYLYPNYPVLDPESHDKPVAAYRTITSTSNNSFNVLDTPFDILNPQPLEYEDHHCLVAEVRHISDSVPDPDWPHEDVSSFDSATALGEWLRYTPTVCWRNIGFIPGGGAQVILTTGVEIPDKFSPTKQWVLEAEAHNAPIGSSWLLHTIPFQGYPTLEKPIGFELSTITNPNMTQGCGFSGLPPGGYKFWAILEWYSNNTQHPGDMSLHLHLHSATSTAGPNLIETAHKILPKEAENWPWSVGIHHPGVENKGDQKKTHIGYLGPRYKNAGLNPSILIGPTPIYTYGTDTWI